MSSVSSEVSVLIPFSNENKEQAEALRACPTAQVKDVYFSNIHAKETLKEYVQRVKEIVKNNKINTILPTTDITTFVHAAIARDFPHIPGPSVESCFLAFHKAYSRHYLDPTDDPTPYDAVDLDSPTMLEDAERALQKVGFPAFLKPATAQQAFGVTKVESFADMKTALMDLKTLRDEHPEFKAAPGASFFREYFMEYLDVQKYPLAIRDVVIVEPFLDAEALCTADGCVVDGEIVHWTITDELRYDGHGAKFTSMLGPTAETQDVQDRMWAIYDGVMNRMIQHGFNHGFTNIEIFRMKDGKLRLCEVNARGSRQVQGIYRQCYTGANQDYVYLTAGRGVRHVTPPPTGRHAVAYMAKFLGLERPGNLMDFDQIANLRTDPDVFFLPYYGPDDDVPDVSGDAGCDLCTVVAYGNSRSAMMRKLTEVLRLVVRKPERLAYPVSEENMMSIL